MLPHYSPGYPEWDIDEQPRLLELINRARPATPMPLEVLESGMLRPKKSLLAVFGVTRHVERVRRADRSESVRELFVRPLSVPAIALPPRAGRTLNCVEITVITAERAHARSADARYNVSLKALARWSDERCRSSRRPTAPSMRCSATKARPAPTWDGRCSFTIM